MPKTRVKRGPGRPAQSENRDTRGDIIKAAETIFAQTGYSAASLRQIALAAAVDLATVKYHFRDKPSLYDEVFLAGNDELLTRLSPSLAQLGASAQRDELIAGVHAFAAELTVYFQERRNYARVLLFRMLEGPCEASPTHEVQGSIASVLTDAFLAIADKPFAQRFDANAYAIYALTAWPSWMYISELHPFFYHDGVTSGPGWSDRAQAFIAELMLRHMVAPNVGSAASATSA